MGTWVAIELLALVSVVWAIVARARQRGVDPTWYAVGVLLSWFVFWFLDGPVLPPLVALALRWGCVGILALVALIAQSDPALQPWSCPECGAVNEPDALTCSCRRVRPDLR